MSNSSILCLLASSTPSGKKGSKSSDLSRRGRGRPKGSGMGRRRGRGSVQKALSAAEAAAMQVGMSKGYAAYGYSLGGTCTGPVRMCIQNGSIN